MGNHWLNYFYGEIPQHWQHGMFLNLLTHQWPARDPVNRRCVRAGRRSALWRLGPRRSVPGSDRWTRRQRRSCKTPPLEGARLVWKTSVLASLVAARSYSLEFWMKMLSVSWSPSLRIFSLYILAMAEMKHWRRSRMWPTPRDRSRPSARSLHSLPGRKDVHDSLLLLSSVGRQAHKTWNHDWVELRFKVVFHHSGPCFSPKLVSVVAFYPV